MSTVTTTAVFQGKWGYYPCDYTTFLKLKHLNKLFQKAQRQKAAWERWYRKEPQNRVMRQKIRNSARQVVGYQPPVPVPEPNINNVFLTKMTGKFSGFSKVYETNVVDLRYDWVPNVYRQARYPGAEGVEPFPSSLKDEIDRLYAQIA